MIVEVKDCFKVTGDLGKTLKDTWMLLQRAIRTNGMDDTYKAIFDRMNVEILDNLAPNSYLKVNKISDDKLYIFELNYQKDDHYYFVKNVFNEDEKYYVELEQVG